MKRVTHMPARRRLRLGTISVEVIVAFSLLTTVLSVSVPLVVRHGRLLVSHRHYRLALDELSNQLEFLAALPESERAEALDRLAPSPFSAARLPGVELCAELETLAYGQRLTVHVVWDEPQRRTAPLSMSAWIHPAPGPGGGQTSESEKP